MNRSSSSFRPLVPLFAFFLLGAIDVFAEEPAPAPLRVERGWVRLQPPSAKVTGAFATLVNEGERPLRVVGGACDLSRSVELHVMEELDGKMRMRKVEAYDVPAGGRFELRPGGPHLMLIDLIGPLSEGKAARCELRLEDGRAVPVELPVRAKAPEELK